MQGVEVGWLVGCQHVSSSDQVGLGCPTNQLSNHPIHPHSTYHLLLAPRLLLLLAQPRVVKLVDQRALLPHLGVLRLRDCGMGVFRIGVGGGGLDVCGYMYAILWVWIRVWGCIGVLVWFRPVIS